MIKRALDRIDFIFLYSQASSEICTDCWAHLAAIFYITNCASYQMTQGGEGSEVFISLLLLNMVSGGEPIIDLIKCDES